MRKRDTKYYTTYDFYEWYIKDIDVDSDFYMSFKQYKEIIEQYFKYIQDCVLENSKTFKLPCRLGFLSIVKKKPKHWDSKSLKIDFNETKKQGKTVWHVNLHTGLYKYRYHWNKQSCLTKNKTRYRFVASRYNKRRLAQILKNHEHDYMEI